MEILKVSLLLAILIISGCGVKRNHIDVATELCKHHDGIGFLYGVLGTRTVNVTCRDGVEIESKTGDK